MTVEQPAFSALSFRGVGGRIAFLAVPVLGVAMIVAGTLLARSAPASFGWFAYAPLTDAVFVNGPPGMWTLGLGLVALGITMFAGWIGFVVGRRTAGRRTSGSTVARVTLRERQDDADLPEYTVDDLQREPVFDVAAFDNDDAVDLGLAALEVIEERGLNLAVRIVLRGDLVFQAKLGTSGPGNDPWLAGKHAVAERFGEPSLLVRRRHEQAGTPFEERSDVDHDAFKAHGGSIPLRVDGEVVGTITTSGEPDVVDHATAAEAIRRYLSDHRSI